MIGCNNQSFHENDMKMISRQTDPGFLGQVRPMHGCGGLREREASLQKGFIITSEFRGS